MSSIIRATTTSGLQVAPDNSGSLQLQTNGTTTALTIDTSQNVGIGTTSPTSILQVQATTPIITINGTGDNVARGINYQLNGTTYASTTLNTNSGEFAISSGQNGSGFYTTFKTGNGTERMRIDSSGNVGIGTASPNEKLTVDGAVISKGAYNGTSNGGAVILSYNTGSNTGSIYALDPTIAWKNLDLGSAQTTFSISGTEQLRITTAGTLTSQATYNNTAAGSTVIVTSAGLIRRTSSSLKYKKDVETLEQTIVDNAVNNLRPVWYRTKNADGDDKATWSHIGLIAEEVDLVEPRLVKYKTVEVTQDEKNANVTTELETPVPEDVDYAKLSVILLAKVKQLEARIAVLEAK
jgi:hypothetical protein